MQRNDERQVSFSFFPLLPFLWCVWLWRESEKREIGERECEKREISEK
jgi:hypothetical protein